jgi:hypothetical protein
MPPRPVLANMEDPIVVTAEEARYWIEVCDSYLDPDADPDEIFSKTELTRANACDWVIQGFPVLMAMLEERDWIFSGDYVERLRLHIRTLEAMIRNLWQATARD